MSQVAPTERGCSFFARTPNEAFSPEDFTHDEQLMVAMASRFVQGEVIPVLDRLEAQEDGLMPSLIHKAGELGFCGVDTPLAYGGLGQSKCLSARILEHLSPNGSFSVTIGVTSGISQIGLTMFGTKAQREKYLPQLASGEWIGAYCLSEPNSGSDALSLSTRAERRGRKFVLSGTKMWISNAKWAHLFLVMAKVDGEHIAAFLVERDSPGVLIEREEHKMGLKGSSTARVVLDQAEVPDENLLYLEGRGHIVALNALNIGRYKLSAMSIGPARAAIGLAASYAVDRKQFGQSLAEFGLVRKKFAEMAARFHAAESMIYRTGSLVDQAFKLIGPADRTADGEDAWGANRAAAEEFAVECSASKVFATEAQAFIVDEGIQVFGGYGFTEEFPMARIYRDSRVSRIYEGTNEINRYFVADRLRRRAADASFHAAGDSFISELAGLALKTCLIKGDDFCGGFGMPQVVAGALADLAILSYAEQSARIRAKHQGGIHSLAHACFVNWANLQAAQAFQLIRGESVAVPSPHSCNLDELAEAILTRRSPI